MYTYNPEDDPINKDPSEIECLVLRYLRLIHGYAADISTIHDKIQQLSNAPKELFMIETSGAVKTLMRRGYLFQANYEYYAITREGQHYINAKDPLFKVVHSTKGPQHDAQ